MSELKAKLNEIFRILNSHREEFEGAAKDSYKETPDEFERRMKIARDQMLEGTEYVRKTDSEILPDDFAERVYESSKKLSTALNTKMEKDIYNLLLYGYTSCSFTFDDGSFEDREETISSLKKRIKYCKNPMEKKKLEKELNALYKSKKRRK